MIPTIKLIKHQPIGATDPSPESSKLIPSKASISAPKPLTRKLFILGLFFPPIIPWILYVTIVKFKPTMDVTNEDHYWVFLCMVALLVVFTLTGGVVLMLGVEFG